MIQAVEHLRPMPGGAQSHLIKADDGNLYVVKFINNPQHRRILANEWIASHVAKVLGLSVPPFAAIDVSPDFLAANPGITMLIRGNLVPAAPGPAFGSRLRMSEGRLPSCRPLPEPWLAEVENIREFAGVLAFDQWVCNCDGRQIVCRRSRRHGGVQALFVDHGFAFSAEAWRFPDSPWRGIYARDYVYHHIRGWSDFEPWLTRIEQFAPARLHDIAASMPAEWCDRADDLDALIQRLILRRSLVRALVRTVRDFVCTPFVNWTRPDPVQAWNPGIVSAGEAA